LTLDGRERKMAQVEVLFEAKCWSTMVSLTIS
jgi:hypothetical protein